MEKLTKEQEIAIQILSKHWLQSTGKEIDSAILKHLDYVVLAMQEYASQMTADRDKRISDLEKELLKADELIEKLSIAPDLAYDAGYLNKEKELIELIKKYETDKPKDI